MRSHSKPPVDNSAAKRTQNYHLGVGPNTVAYIPLDCVKPSRVPYVLTYSMLGSNVLALVCSARYKCGHASSHTCKKPTVQACSGPCVGAAWLLGFNCALARLPLASASRWARSSRSGPPRSRVLNQSTRPDTCAADSNGRRMFPLGCGCKSRGTAA